VIEPVDAALVVTEPSVTAEVTGPSFTTVDSEQIVVSSHIVAGPIGVTGIMGGSLGSSG